MKVLGYLRASTAAQEKADTLEIQREAIRAFCAARTWDVQLFEDNNVEGEILLEHRRAGKLLLQALAKGQGERVIVWKADRLGRGPEAYVTAIARIERFAPIESVVEGAALSVKQPGKITMTMLYGGIAAEEKISIVKRTGAGSWIKARDAYHWMGGPAPYGYIIEGNNKTAHLVKSTASTTGNTRIKSEVDVVRRIYMMAARGDSCRTISDYLNHLGIPPQKRENRPATRWTPGRVRNVILNEIYMGMHYYGRRKVYRNEDDPGRKPHAKCVGRQHWLKRPVPALAIVDEKLWREANAAVKANLSLSRAHAKNDYLLSGLIRCACGRTFAGTPVARGHGKWDRYYRCGGRNAAYNASGVRCDAPHIRADDLETVVWDDVYRLILKPGATLREIDEQLTAEEGPYHNVADEIAELEASLAGRQQHKKEYYRQAARGKLTDADLDALVQEVEKEEAGLRQEIERLRAQRATARTRVLAMEAARGMLESLRKDVLSGTLQFEKKRQLVRAVVSGITVKGTAGNKPEIAVHYCFGPHAERFSVRSANDGTVNRWSSPRN